jgi:predicted PurR-regulated permease PerM
MGHFRARLTRHGDGAPHNNTEPQDAVLEIEPGELERVFVAPRWLRDAGLVAWLLVGIVLVVAGAVWLLALTSTIFVPVVTASLIAAVAGPLVDKLQHHHVPRAGGAALVLLAIVLIGIGVGLLVLGGITNQSANISQHLTEATDKITGWVKDLGVSKQHAESADADARSSVSSAAHLLLNGLATGISELAGFAIFAAFTVLSLFFLLKDGPSLGGWIERHSGVSRPVAHTILGELARAMRGYFGGVTIVAAFTATIVFFAAVIIGVPLAGTIAVVTFLGGYVPYLGAWIAGAFAVLLALGSSGAGAAVAIAVVSLLGNGALQQVVQPIAFGATLGLHPLVVLVVTIAAGSLFGLIGLVLAAPITSAIVHISAELGRARREAEARAAAPAAPQPPDAPDATDIATATT